jgi:mycofactocin precursor
MSAELLEPATADDSRDVDEPAAADDLVTSDLVTGELLVEEISIDGMCGVY